MPLMVKNAIGMPARPRRATSRRARSSRASRYSTFFALLVTSVLRREVSAKAIVVSKVPPVLRVATSALRFRYARRWLMKRASVSSWPTS